MSSQRILVIEDEAITAQDLKYRLERLGYTVVGTVGSGEEAIKKAKETYPDLILVDISLKGEMDGIEAAQQIHSQFNIPAIIITAHTDPDTIARSKLADPFGYLCKPIDDRELHATIETAFSKFALEWQLKENGRLLSLTLNSLSDAIIITEDDEYISFMNPTAQSLTGWNSEDVLGKRLDEILVLFDSASDQNPDNQLQLHFDERKNQCLPSNIMLLSKDGQKRAIEGNFGPILDENKRILNYIINFRLQKSANE